MGFFREDAFHGHVRFVAVLYKIELASHLPIARELRLFCSTNDLTVSKTPPNWHSDPAKYQTEIAPSKFHRILAAQSLSNAVHPA
jgi:hypothetical protein